MVFAAVLAKHYTGPHNSFRTWSNLFAQFCHQLICAFFLKRAQYKSRLLCSVRRKTGEAPACQVHYRAEYRRLAPVFLLCLSMFHKLKQLQQHLDSQ